MSWDISKIKLEFAWYYAWWIIHEYKFYANDGNYKFGIAWNFDDADFLMNFNPIIKTAKTVGCEGQNWKEKYLITFNTCFNKFSIPQNSFNTRHKQATKSIFYPPLSLHTQQINGWIFHIINSALFRFKKLTEKKKDKWTAAPVIQINIQYMKYKPYF